MGKNLGAALIRKLVQPKMKYFRCEFDTSYVSKDAFVKIVMM